MMMMMMTTIDSVASLQRMYTRKTGAFTGVELGFEADVVATALPRKLVVVTDKALRIRSE